MEMDLGSGEPIKVEVVNFDNLRDNTVKVVLAAVAGTIATKLVEKSIETYFAKRKLKKKSETTTDN